MRADVTQKRLFLGRKLQVGPRDVNLYVAATGIHLVLCGGAIDALAGHAPDDHDGRVGVFLRVGKELLAVAVFVVDARLVQPAELGGVAVERTSAFIGSLAVKVLVHAREFRVVLNTGVRQSVENPGDGAAYLARPGTRGYPLGRGPAKDVDLIRRLGKRERLALVANEHKALGLDTLRKRAPVVHDGGLLFLGDLDLADTQVRIDGVPKENQADVRGRHGNERKGRARVPSDPENALLCRGLHDAYLLALSNSSLNEENILPIRPICLPTAFAAASEVGF